MKVTEIFFGAVCLCLIVGSLGLVVPVWLEPWYATPGIVCEISFSFGLIGAFLIVPAVSLVED